MCGPDCLRVTVRPADVVPRASSAERRFPTGHVRSEGKNGRLGTRLMALVAEGDRERVYLPPDIEHEAAALRAAPSWRPEAALATNSRHMTPVIYGMTSFGDLFTSRQLVALTTFTDLIGELRELAMEHGAEAAYADAIATYLALAAERCVDYWSALATWVPTGEFIRDTFARQALSMTWDLAEANPFSTSTGNWSGACDWVRTALETCPATPPGFVAQREATRSLSMPSPMLVCTDPPYYDNVPYADLADFFYVWLRRSLTKVYPELFGTLLVPKTEELVADSHRFGGSRSRPAASLKTVWRGFSMARAK